MLYKLSLLKITIILHILELKNIFKMIIYLQT